MGGGRGGGYVPPHLRGGGAPPRARGGGPRGPSGSSSSSSSARGGVSHAPRAPPSRRTPADVIADAIAARDAAERKYGRDGALGAPEAHAAFLAAASSLRSALDAPDAGTARLFIAEPELAHDAALALGESLAAAALARVTASRLGPLTPESLPRERAAIHEALGLLEDARRVLDDLADMADENAAREDELRATRRSRGAAGAAFADDRFSRTDLPSSSVIVAAVTAAANARAAMGDLATLLAEDDPNGKAEETHATGSQNLEESERSKSQNQNQNHRGTRTQVAVAHLEGALLGYRRALAFESNRLAAIDRARATRDDPNFASNSAAHGDWLAACWNVADALGKLGDAHGALAGDFETARRWHEEASATFTLATQRADSAAGDDLGGLVYDWGCQRVQFAQRAADRAVKLCAAGDNGNARTLAELALDLFSDAEARLRRAAEFSPGDAACLNAAGEAMQARAELLKKCPPARDAEAERFEKTVSPLDLASAPLLRALDETGGGGFASALRVDRRNLDATIGAAECRCELGRLRERFEGDAVGARAHFREAWATYRRALATMEEMSGGTDPGGVGERLGVVYEAACCAALAGETEDATRMLESVFSCGGCTRAQVEADEDLRNVRGVGAGGGGGG